MRPSEAFEFDDVEYERRARNMTANSLWQRQRAKDRTKVTSGTGIAISGAMVATGHLYSTLGLWASGRTLDIARRKKLIIDNEVKRRQLPNYERKTRDILGPLLLTATSAALFLELGNIIQDTFSPVQAGQHTIVPSSQDFQQHTFSASHDPQSHVTAHYNGEQGPNTCPHALERSHTHLDILGLDGTLSVVHDPDTNIGALERTIGNGNIEASRTSPEGFLMNIDFSMDQNGQVALAHPESLERFSLSAQLQALAGILLVPFVFVSTLEGLPLSQRIKTDQSNERCADASLPTTLVTCETCEVDIHTRRQAYYHCCICRSNTARKGHRKTGLDLCGRCVTSQGYGCSDKADHVLLRKGLLSPSMN